jgi:hypothetical protein
MIRLKDCQAWFVNDNNLCRKRSLNDIADVTELTSYLRYDAIYKMISKVCLGNVADPKKKNRDPGRIPALW